MASYEPVVKNGASGAVFYLSLPNFTGAGFKASPTLAAGDVKIAIDDGAPANLGTLPVVDADFTKRVKVTLSQAETNGDNLTIIFSDQTSPPEWTDVIVNIRTVAGNFDTLKTTVDAIQAQTDELTFTVPGYLDVNVKAVNDITVGGDGTAGNPWGPA